MAVHKHNDYSCYIHVVNKTHFDLELVDFKAVKGTWAHGGPPKRIAGNTTALVELTDPKGPHGSKGTCKYMFHHPGRQSSSVTFRLKFEDPYWGGDDNYLHAVSQYHDYVSLDVKKYATSGHPFNAYVEVQIPSPRRQYSRRSTRSRPDTASSVISSEGSNDSFVQESPSEQLPGYLSRSDSSSDAPVRDVELVKNNPEADQHKHGKNDSAISITYLDGDGFGQEEQPTHGVPVEKPESDIPAAPEAKAPELAVVTEPEIPSEPVPVEESDVHDEPSVPAPVPEPSLPESTVSPVSEPVATATPIPEPEKDIVAVPAIEKEIEEASPEPQPVSQHQLEIDVAKPQPSQDRSIHEPTQKPSQEPREVSTPVHSNPQKESKLEDEYVEFDKIKVEKQSISPPETPAQKPATTPVEEESLGSYWGTILSSPHGRFGVAAFVFLTVYGVTATRISRGLLLASVTR